MIELKNSLKKKNHKTNKYIEKGQNYFLNMYKKDLSVKFKIFIL